MERQGENAVGIKLKDVDVIVGTKKKKKMVLSIITSNQKMHDCPKYSFASKQPQRCLSNRKEN